jgi:hypothetical protein
MEDRGEDQVIAQRGIEYDVIRGAERPFHAKIVFHKHLAVAVDGIE